jgi:glutamate formiminotransferase/formiminotetrahydrofolate cyclodeaminase
MNLVDFEKTQLHQAFEAVRREAEHLGVMIAGSEIVGLIPRAAIDRAAEYFLRLENFSSGVVLEERISMAFEAKGEGKSVDFAEQLSSGEATPGGGAASAYAATLGASLGEMIARLTVGREKYADVAGEVQEALAELRPLRERLQRAVVEDGVSFSRVMDARRMTKATEEARADRENRIEEALKGATTVPLEVAGAAVQVLEILETLAEIGNSNALADAAIGAQLVQAAVVSARYNVLMNTIEIQDDEFRVEHCSRIDDLVERAREIAARIDGLFLEAVR